MKIISIHFSSSGESRKVAEYYAKKLSCPCYDLTSKQAREHFDFNKYYDLIILSFPVYAQNIPQPLKTILSKLNSSFFIINITYEKMSFGNCLKDTKSYLTVRLSEQVSSLPNTLI